MNLKAYTREQLNTLSSDYLVIGKEVLVMFGYSDPSNSSSIKSIVNLRNPDPNPEDNIDDLLTTGKAELEGRTALYSGGKLYSKIASVGGFDINVQPDDGSFDISITLYTEGILATYKAKNDKLAQEAGIDILTNKSTPIQEKKGDEKEINYALYQDFLLKLRGFPEKSLSKHGKSKKFIIPTRDSIFTIGQGRTIKYTETLNYEREAGKDDDDPLIDNEERTNPPGFAADPDAPKSIVGEIDVKEGEESDKSLTTNGEFTSKLFPNPESTTPEDMEQFVVSVRPNEENGGASKSGNKEVQQMYLTWGLCEWIINNGIGYEESVEGGTIVKDILRKFSEPSLPRRVYSIPQKEKTIEEEYTTPVPNEGGEFIPPAKTQTRTKTVYTDDNANRQLVSDIPASHKEGTFIRSVVFPKLDLVKGTDLKDKQPKTMGGLKSEDTEKYLMDGVKGKFLSTTGGIPNELFSTNPGICVLSKEKGLVSPVEVKENDVPIEGKVFRMKDLHENFSSFSESKEKIYVRNILVNAKWFFDEYVKYTEDTEKSLKGLVDTLFVQISGCFNEMVKFKTRVDDDGALVVYDADVNQKVYSKVELETAKLDYREVDYLNKKFRIYSQITPLNVFGQDSIVRDISYSMDLDSDISNHFFYQDNNDLISSGTDDLQKLTSLIKERAILQSTNKETDAIDKKIKAREESLKEKESTSKSYLDLYLESATKTYGKLIPKKNTSVDFSSQSEILKTKLTKILTSAVVVNSKKELQPPPNTPKLPFKVDVTLDGIAGIKMFDAFHLSYVPALYQNGHFKVVGISHSLEGTDWSTKLSLIYIEAGEVRTEEF